MKIGESVNEFGTPVSVHRCDDCGDEFTVCPCQPDDREWGGCLAESCASYDMDRDVDLWFEPALEAGWIKREALDDV